MSNSLLYKYEPIQRAHTTWIREFGQYKCLLYRFRQEDRRDGRNEGGIKFPPWILHVQLFCINGHICGHADKGQKSWVYLVADRFAQRFRALRVHRRTSLRNPRIH